MGLNCGCPVGAHIADLDIKECKESMGQVQKVAFQRIYKTSYSKYGTAYQTMIFPYLQGGRKYA